MKLRRIEGDLWEIPREGRMKVPGRVYSVGPPSPDDPALQQVVNVAHLPGILRFSLAMPDIHWGYGFPIGGVAAVDAERGAISPGGVGYDINCGVRVVTTALEEEVVRARLHDVTAQLYRDIPTGVGASAAIPRLSDAELDEVLSQGARWAVRRGFAAASDDAERCEEGGRLAAADPSAVSARARQRGADQVGTLGSGNHFVEVDRVAEVYDEPAAEAFGLVPGRIALQIHSGSRGLGYQVCDEFLAELGPRLVEYGEEYAALPDRQLACAPVASDEGRRLPRGDAGRRELRLGEPPGDDRARRSRPPPHPEDLRARARRVAPLRRLPQRGEARGPRGGWSAARRPRPSQGGDALPSGPATRASPRPTARSGSRCSSPGTWGATPTSSPGRRRR